MSRYMRVAAIQPRGALLTMGGIATANATTVVPGTSAENPIVVKSLTDVPQGAVQDKVSTFETDAKCDTTKSWVLPGSDAVTHPEGQYLRVIPEQDAVTHQEWNIEGREPHLHPRGGGGLAPGVQVRADGRRLHDSVPVRQVHPDQEPAPPRAVLAALLVELGPGSLRQPSDVARRPTGTWQHQNRSRTARAPGSGPLHVPQLSGQRHGSLTARHARPARLWSVGAIGPWTQWEPMTHESWQDSDAPLGAPAIPRFEARTQQRRITASGRTGPPVKTRQVKTGTEHARPPTGCSARPRATAGRRSTSARS